MKQFLVCMGALWSAITNLTLWWFAAGSTVNATTVLWITLAAIGSVCAATALWVRYIEECKE